jgi:hypothetical protein
MKIKMKMEMEMDLINGSLGFQRLRGAALSYVLCSLESSGVFTLAWYH